MGYAIVSKLIIEDKYPIRFLYRETPSDESDTGWRIMAGIETQEYADNPDNLGIYDIRNIVEQDSSIIDLLRYDVGSSFERASENSKWTKIIDNES